MKEYIKKSSLKENVNRQYSIHKTPIRVIHQFTNNINLKYIVDKIESLIPETLLYNVEVIYIAYIEDFTRGDRTFNAMYKDGAIYISPYQDNEEDLLDDIIHEISHSLEKAYQEHIYKDEYLEREFLAKRRTLYHLINDYKMPNAEWNNINYSPEFDNYLYNDIGYDKLRAISSSLFYSPYAITSLREYWANGFENYLLGDKQKLKDISPILFNKINTLIKQQEIY